MTYEIAVANKVGRYLINIRVYSSIFIQYNILCIKTKAVTISWWEGMNFTQASISYTYIILFYHFATWAELRVRLAPFRNVGLYSHAHTCIMYIILLLYLHIVE